MNGKNENDVYLQAITLIDPATSRIEIHAVPEDRADLFAIQVELALLVMYPLPNKIVVDREKDFFCRIQNNDGK